MTNWLTFMLVLTGGSALLAAEPTNEPAGADAWGSVAGRVVFEGDLKNPALKRYQDELKIREPISIQESERGVEGRVIAAVPNESLLIDPKTHGIKNVMVYLLAKPKRVHPALVAQKSKAVEVTVRDHQFVPRALIVKIGQTVRMTVSSPGMPTNFKGEPIANPLFNLLVTPNNPAEWVPQKPERLPIRITSNIAQAAISYWLVVDHPYAALTASDGSFRLDNLPAGDHDLRLWQETVGYVEKRLRITVRAGETQELASIKITAERLKR